MFRPGTPPASTDAFERPLPFARGRSRRRLEVFSPKLGRRLSLASYGAWQLWLALEANPLVQRFCERPVFLPEQPGRTVDFWVQTASRPAGEFWLLREDAPVAGSAGDGSLPGDFSGDPEATLATAPSTLFGRPLKTIDASSLRQWSVPVANWAQIVPHLVSWHRFPDALLAQSIAVFLGTYRTLDEVLAQFADHDRTCVEAALFDLVAKGRAKSPDLAEHPLTGATRFKRV